MSQVKAKLPTVKPLRDLQAYMNAYGDQPAAALYVLNQTRERASILLTCVSDRGESLSVLIPYSIAPFDITTIIPRSDLVASPDFRRALSAGYIRIIDNESAIAALGNKVVRQEAEKLFRTNSTNSMTTNDEEIQLATFAKTLAVNEVESNYHPVVAELLAFTEDDAKLNRSKMETMLINSLSELTEEDIEYLRKNSTTKELTDMLVDLLED